MENLMNIVGKLASKKFSVKIYTMDDNDTKECLEMNYLELGTYLLSHSIKQIDIIEIFD